MDKSYCNSHGNSAYNGNSGSGQSPATVTITGVRLGAGDDHWWRLA